MCFCLAPIVLEPLLNFCKSTTNQIIVLLLSLNAAIFLGLVIFRFQISEPHNVIILFVLTIIQGMLYSGPFCRVGLNEMAVEGGGDSKVLFNMFTAFTLFQCMGSTFSYYLIGYLM